jgi:hypothetical protein
VRACTGATNGLCCALGRPFLVDGEARLAPVAARGDWRSGAAPDTAGLTPGLRALLAQHWTETALLEHASIAAFARFALQLLAVGAPPDLVADAQRAMADETTHTRLAFGLASAYAGCDLGPGPLATDACLDGANQLGHLVATTFVEGCIGETIAALEAREALAAVRDPAVRAVLEAIARDEARHAELAWRTVAWALAAFGRDARDAIEGAVAKASLEASAGDAPCSVEQDALRVHGVLGDRLRGRLRGEALRRIVIPLATALLGEHAAPGAVASYEACAFASAPAPAPDAPHTAA